jgi:hypothetical protein
MNGFLIPSARFANPTHVKKLGTKNEGQQAGGTADAIPPTFGFSFLTPTSTNTHPAAPSLLISLARTRNNRTLSVPT